MKLKQLTPVMLALSVSAAPAVSGASEELARNSNCLACHKVDTRLVGPSLQEIAAKYKDDATAADTLIEKVKAGGVGVWGQIPMPPNPLVNDADAKTLVDWILSL